MRQSIATLFALLIAAALRVDAADHRFSGFLEEKTFLFATTATPQDALVESWGTVFARADGRLGRVRWRASLRAEGITSSERGALALDLADRLPRRSPLSVRELHFTLPVAAGVDLQLGKFELGWGKTDGYSPADAFLPRDASDPFADEKLPLWGARLSGQRGPVRFELYASAVTTPWRLPVMQGRYSPVSAQNVYIFDARNSPPQGGFQALRVLASTGPWDLGAWVRAGVRPAPLLSVLLDAPQIVDGAIFLLAERRFASEHGAGIEVSRVAGPWVVRGEAAFLSSRDGDLGEALIWTFSAERPLRDGSVIVTAAGNLRQTPINKAFLFDRAILPAVIVACVQPESWGGWNLVYIRSFHPSGGVFKWDVDRELTDRWKLELGGDFPHGDRSGPLGALAGARRLRAALRWSW